jgi:hypothetical protein
MTLKSILIPAGCLLLGTGIGILLPVGGGGGATPGTPPEAASAAGEARPAAGSWRSAAPTRPDRVRPDAPEHSSAEPTAADFVQVPTSLIGELSLGAAVRTLDEGLFDADGRIEEQLGITDSEKARIQTAWRGVREKIREVELSVVETEELEDGSARITVPDLAPRLESVREGFGSRLDGILGDNRGAVFRALRQTDRMLARPEGRKVYTVTSESVGNGEWRFRIRLEDSAGSRLWVGDSVPEELRHLTDAARVVSSLNE